MYKKRLLFSKTERAKYISHLDLLRTFQRMFRRAGIELRHSEGFNPHPHLAFALPLSVGAESVCELLDAELLTDIPEAELPVLLTRAAPEGIRVLEAYTPSPATKFADIKWLEVEGRLSYDREGAAAEAVPALDRLFKSPALVITKKTKKGIGDFDVKAAVESISFDHAGGDVKVRAVISAQNPTMNPDNLITAIETHLPGFLPDFASFRRLEIFDKDRRVFR